MNMEKGNFKNFEHSYKINKTSYNNNFFAVVIRRKRKFILVKKFFWVSGTLIAFIHRIIHIAGVHGFVSLTVILRLYQTMYMQ